MKPLIMKHQKQVRPVTVSVIAVSSSTSAPAARAAAPTCLDTVLTRLCVLCAGQGNVTAGYGSCAGAAASPQGSP